MPPPVVSIPPLNESPEKKEISPILALEFAVMTAKVCPVGRWVIIRLPLISAKLKSS